MTNDKELLELAAKAAGIEIIGLVDKMIAQPDHRTGGFIIRNDRGGDSCWNPLTDDGDALRLAVKLGMEVDIWKQGNRTIVSHFILSQNHIIETSDDLYAATRRAIVRAAAELGKASVEIGKTL